MLTLATAAAAATTAAVAVAVFSAATIPVPALPATMTTIRMTTQGAIVIWFWFCHDFLMKSLEK